MEANYTQRDTPEQDALRAIFISSHKAAHTTACPCCLPGVRRKSSGFFERGTCGELVAMRCNNCSFIRTSKPRAKSEGHTPAQLRLLVKINHLFAPKAEKLKQWEVTPDGHGGLWVSVETEGNVFTRRGAHIHIGARGSFKIASVYDLCTSTEVTETVRAHYEFMLK